MQLSVFAVAAVAALAINSDLAIAGADPLPTVWLDIQRVSYIESGSGDDDEGPEEYLLISMMDFNDRTDKDYFFVNLEGVLDGLPSHTVETNSPPEESDDDVYTWSEGIPAMFEFLSDKQGSRPKIRILSPHQKVEDVRRFFQLAWEDVTEYSPETVRGLRPEMVDWTKVASDMLDDNAMTTLETVQHRDLGSLGENDHDKIVINCLKTILTEHVFITRHLELTADDFRGRH